MSVRYSESPVMFKNHPFGFILSLLLIPAFGIGLIILLVWHLKNKSSKIEVTDNEIVHETGLLNKEHAELSIRSIRTVKVKQSFFNRIFGVGSVEIYTAGDNPEICISGIPDPNKVRELIKMGQNGGAK